MGGGLVAAMSYDKATTINSRFENILIARSSTRSRRLHALLKTLRNEDRNANGDGSEKSHFWFAFMCGSLGLCFFALKFVDENKKLNLNVSPSS